MKIKISYEESKRIKITHADVSCQDGNLWEVVSEAKMSLQENPQGVVSRLDAYGKERKAGLLRACDAGLAAPIDPQGVLSFSIGPGWGRVGVYSSVVTTMVCKLLLRRGE